MFYFVEKLFMNATTISLAHLNVIKIVNVNFHFIFFSSFDEIYQRT